MTDVQNRASAVEARVEELLAAMTLAEKAGQLSQYFYFGIPDARRRDTAEATGGGGRAGAAGAGRCCSRPGGRDQPAAAAGRRRQSSRHSCPVRLRRHPRLRTILPVPIAMAASWDPETIERGRAVAAREARAVGIHWTFAPMVDIARDPRWGRIIEGRGGSYLAPRLPRLRCAGSKATESAHRSASSPGRSTSPATGRRLGVVTTTRSICPTTSCGTCTSGRSRRRWRPARAT